MYFEPYGPFYPRDFLESNDRDWKGQFWKSVESEYDGLASANGVYVFSLQFGTKFTPWYVGKTCSAKGFKGEVFQGHKLNHYFAAADGRKGKPVLHLIARVEKKRGNFCRSSARSHDQIERLETYLIGMALSANSALRNNRKTKFLRRLDIAGVIGPKYEGRPYEDARTLRRVLDL